MQNFYFLCFMHTHLEKDINYTMKTKKQTIFSYIAILGGILLVAGLGSLFVQMGMSWYKTLTTPSQFPPNYVVPIMWTIIYGIFAIVLCLWVRKDDISVSIISLLILNGIMNVVWCLVFFTLEQTFLGLVAIIWVLMLSIVLLKYIFNYKKTYALLNILYPIWVSIATALNLALWILN